MILQGEIPGLEADQGKIEQFEPNYLQLDRMVQGEIGGILIAGLQKSAVTRVVTRIAIDW